MKRLILSLTPFALIAAFTLGCKAEFQGGSYNGFVIFAETVNGTRYTEFNIVLRKEGARWTGYIQPKNEQSAEMSSLVVGPSDRITFTAGVKNKGERSETISFEGKYYDDKIEGRVKHIRQKYQDEIMVDRIKPAWLVASKQGLKMTSEEAQRISDQHNITEFMRDYQIKMKQSKSQEDTRRITVAMLCERLRELPPNLTTTDGYSPFGNLPYKLDFHLYERNSNKGIANVIYRADLDFSTENWSESFDVEWQNRPGGQ